MAISGIGAGPDLTLLQRGAQLPERAVTAPRIGIEGVDGADGSSNVGNSPAVSPLADAGAGTFAQMLKRVSEADKSAQVMTTSFANGEQQNLHETMLTLEHADISLTLLTSVRNRLLEAYREVMRMS